MSDYHGLQIINKILEVFQPSAVVLQCGSDSLSGDKLGCFNLTMQGHAHCVQFIRSKNIPLILLGGGGYTVKNVGRTWAYETACALGIEDTIDPNLPWNEYFEWFGPRYRLEVVASNMEDLNVKEKSLETVKNIALKNLNSIKGPPSVQMQDVPRQPLGDHLKTKRLEGEEDDERDNLDKRLARTYFHLPFIRNVLTVLRRTRSLRLRPPAILPGILLPIRLLLRLRRLRAAHLHLRPPPRRRAEDQAAHVHPHQPLLRRARRAGVRAL